MFAVIRTGGKQYRVAENDLIAVERLAGEPGDSIDLADVLMIGGDGEAPTVGAPVLDKAMVRAEVVEQKLGKKVLIFKKIRRQNHRRKRGHRQELTLLRITGISPTGEPPAPKAAAAAESPAEDAPAAKPKAKKARKPAETEE